MAVVQWTSKGSGNWLTASDWSGGVVPGATDNVQIEVPNITVTINSGTLAVASLVTAGSTLSIDGTSSLSISGMVDIGGAFLESVGTLALGGSLSTFGGLVDVTGGTFNLDNGSLVANGAFEANGGTFTLDGQNSTFNAALTESAGTITFAGNELTAEDGFSQTGGSLALRSNALFLGSLSQTGSLSLIDQTGGLLTDDGSFSQSGGALELEGGGAVFNGAITLASGTVYDGNGEFISNQSMAMSGGALTLAGSFANFYGVTTQTGGVIALVDGALTSYGTFTEKGGQLSLGDVGGGFNDLTLESGTITSSAATLNVAGTFSQTGGTLAFLGRDTIFSGPFSETSSGSILVESGALELEGNGTLAGAIGGVGKILVESGNTTIASTAKISLPSIEIFDGTLTLASGRALTQSLTLLSNGRLITDGYSLTLDASSTLYGEVVGTSVITMADGGVVNGLTLDGTSRVYLDSSVNQTGNIALAYGGSPGSRTIFDIEAKGRLRIAGNFGVSDPSANGELVNAGALTKTGGSGTAIIDTNVSSTGSIGINIGTLEFEGPDNSFGGTISGPGTFAIGGGQNSFSASLSLGSERFILEQGTEQLTLTNNLAYGGEWSQIGGTLWLDGTNVTVTTGGETGLDGGMVTGSGIFSTVENAAVNISGIDFEGTSTLKVAGAVNQTSSVGFGAELGSAPILDIASTAVWTIENNASLGGQVNSLNFQNGTFVNDGTVQKVNGSANSFIVGDFINAGTLAVDNSLLTLNGFGTLAGTLVGNGDLNLSGDYTLASGLSTSIQVIDVASGTTTLGENLTDAKTWAQSGSQNAVDLNGYTLTLNGLVSLEGGLLSGPGTMIASSTIALGDNYGVSAGTLLITGHADQVGDISIGDVSGQLQNPPQAGTLPPSLATVEIASGANYYLDDSTNISSNGTLAVAGTLSALGGGNSIIGPSVIDTGSIMAHAAELQFIGPVSGAGKIVIGAGGSLEFSGSVAASTTVSFAAGAASIFLNDVVQNTNALSFDASVAGFQTGDFIEISNLTQNPSQVALILNSTGTIATLTDTNGDSDTITFTAAEKMSALAIGIGPHNDITLFHT